MRFAVIIDHLELDGYFVSRRESLYDTAEILVCFLRLVSVDVEKAITFLKEKGFHECDATWLPSGIFFSFFGPDEANVYDINRVKAAHTCFAVISRRPICSVETFFSAFPQKEK